MIESTCKDWDEINNRVIKHGKFRDLDGCWEWCGYRSKAGYGKVTINKETNYVHRFMVESIIGRRLNRTEHVDHLCRNRACFRPSHLEAVSVEENVRRGKLGKLSKLDVLEMHVMTKLGYMNKDIAEKFGVHRTHVSKILNGKRFKIAIPRDRHRHIRSRKYGRDHDRKEQLKLELE